MLVDVGEPERLTVDLQDPTLRWMRALATALLDDPRGLDVAASALFAGAVRCRRLLERDDTRRWLNGLDGQAAETVAAALARQRGARAWYTAEGWRPASAADPAMRAALGR